MARCNRPSGASGANRPKPRERPRSSGRILARKAPNNRRERKGTVAGTTRNYFTFLRGKSARTNFAELKTNRVATMTHISRLLRSKKGKNWIRE